MRFFIFSVPVFYRGDNHRANNIAVKYYLFLFTFSDIEINQ
ncbi:hypothetical protein CSC12_1906 [Klebsiella michiganensis]|nr:hypothetical protein CSC12_1906 [Klebsiella michiganensis]